MSLPKPSFSVRIVVCDHYLARPIPGIDVIYSEFRGSDIKQVPVLRIFGPALDGRKTCLHVHGVFPYFYVPCPTQHPEPQFLYQIAASLDKALNIALKQASSANQHVYKVSLVKGLPFYGFHDKEHLYLKIFLYNPGLIKQAVELCSNGAILGQTFQPHESHLNFTLQFFIDFNLFGMSNIDLQTVNLRKRPGTSQNSNDPTDEEVTIKPESICYYEADCIASHIINRQRIGRGDGIENPGLEEVWNQEKERRKLLNMSIASKSLSQARLRDTETDSHYKYEQMIKIKLSGLVSEPVKVDTEQREQVHYPAESMEGTQLFSAVDVSMHLPENSLSASFNLSLRHPLSDETLVGDPDATLVNETVALNSSLQVQYSQVMLDNEDMDLLDVLKDMDQNSIEDDSVLGTPAQENQLEVDEYDDDAEYSQIFNEETVLIDPDDSKEEAPSVSESWNDSFWEGANIPQLDGTCDDDHVKKVRKRKMRPLKLGLSRPKAKKNDTPTIPVEVKEEPVPNLDISIPDEINESRETINSVSSFHLKKSLKVSKCASDIDLEASQDSNLSVTDLVQKVSAKFNSHKEPAKSYDLVHKYEPTAGPSTTAIKTENNNSKINIKDDLSNDSYSESSPESDDLGFISFYDRSKIFDLSIDNYDDVVNHSSNEVPKVEEVKMDVEEDHKLVEIKMESTTRTSSIMFKNDVLITETADDMKLHYSDSTQESEDHKPVKHSAYIITPKFRPPSHSDVVSSFEKYKIPKIKALQPHYSNHKDVGDKVEIGHMLIKLHSNLAKDQKPFEKVIDTTSIEEWRQLLFLERNDMTDETSKPDNLKRVLAGNRKCVLEPLLKPPTRIEVLKFLENKENNVEVNQAEVTEVLVDDDLENSQAIGLNEDEINSSISPEADDKDKSNVTDSLQVTMQPDGSFLCFGTGESQHDSPDSPVVEINYLTVMLLEVHTTIRGDFVPDPLLDALQAVFLTVTNDCPDDHFLDKSTTEIIVVDPMPDPKYFDRCLTNMENVALTYVDTERDLLEKVVESIRRHDPDIMCGYEIETRSWGYMLERSEVLGLEIVMEVSRITEKYRQKRWKRDENDYEGRILGRVLFNVWRLFRHELALSSYSFENCMHEILKERVPSYSYAQLAAWWNDESRILRWIPVEYYLARLSGTVRMLEKLDIINRTAELARLFGLQWWEVLSRGSQFRVESLMLRAARPLNLVALSPTVKQRAAMRAPEFLPLIFEPQSRFYADPVIVLDFQSLYPSVMIAYNYCFSTCIGRVENITGDASYEFGAWRLRIPKAKLLALLSSGLVHFSPAGAGFVSAAARRGVLPALLRRILAARQAVKGSMKRQTDPQVKKAMHSRQLGLKLIANVTYGYTAANFSGRMPCVEVGDSVVAKGRETLERAIKLVEDGRWNAKVVYGDTDSMFVVVPGGSRQEAFQIGQEIADAVTADNPSPVALKLEKVYQPCILQTKKRYVGHMYESAAQETPAYEAKGIETVRRDGCPAAVQLLQRSLCELFSSRDMSRVKRLVMSTLSQLASGTLPPQQLLFTREYHGAAGYRPGASAPPAEIAKRLLSRDRRAAPRTGQRVSWLVTAGAPGLPLVKLARSPQELLRSPQRPHVAYYATRALLPPLHRCLSLLGVDVFKWWSELGYVREIQHGAQASGGGGGGIARYLWRERCALCGARATRSLCAQCAGRPQSAVAALCTQLNVAASHVQSLEQVCSSCAGHGRPEVCESTECPTLWRRQVAQQKLTQVQDIIRQVPAQLKCVESIDF